MPKRFPVRITNFYNKNVIKFGNRAVKNSQKICDIAERWKQHIKRGIGAEAPTRNKLYPAMLQFGVENFTFEIVEECDKSLLDSREDYYQEFFHTKDFGYSIK